MSKERNSDLAEAHFRECSQAHWLCTETVSITVTFISNEADILISVSPTLSPYLICSIIGKSEVLLTYYKNSVIE